MAYNPGITNRSGEILAQGIASAAQTRMQGYQNATNSLLKGFTDLTKEQQEEEIKRNEALAKFKSDPDLLAKLGEKGNEDLKARYDRINAPVEGFWAKYAGRGDLEDSDLLYKYATGTQEATAKANAKELLAYERAKQKRLSDEDARIDELNKNLRTAVGPAASLMNDSSLTPISGQNTPYNPTNFTTPFNPSSKVPPMVREMSVFQGNPEHYSTSPATPLYKDPRVSGFLKDQSEMLRNSNNTASPIPPNNSFIQSPRETPMDMSARNLAQTLPSFDRNNGGGSQVVSEKPVDNSILSQLVRSGVRITPEMLTSAIGDQAKIGLQQRGLDIEQQKVSSLGETGTFIAYDEDGQPEKREWIRRGEVVLDKDTMLPLQTPTTDMMTNQRIYTATSFPRMGGAKKPTRRTGFPNFGAGGAAGDGKINKRTTMSGIGYTVSNIP